MAENVATSYQYDAGEDGIEHSQLSAVQGLVDFTMLDHLHSLLWVVKLHLRVLNIVSTMFHTPDL